MAKNKFQWEADSGRPRDEPLPSRGRSKQKRDAKAVEDLLDELLKLGTAEAAALPVAEETVDALAKLRDLQARGVRGGFRRQRLLTAGRLRDEDLDAVRAALPAHPGVSPRETALRVVELWRARLLEDSDGALDELIAEHPDGDRQRLRQLIRQARKDAARPGERSSKAFRELFAVLRELVGV